MIRVLFVCMGNICRSPMAEAVFQDRIDRAGLTEYFRIDSAGTGDWHAGERAHPGTLAVLARNHIAYEGRARQITRDDFTDFEHILAMDSDNLRVISGIKHKGYARVARFLDLARSQGLTKYDNVPDPFYDNTFDRVYELVTIGADTLLEQLRKENGL